MIMSRDQRKGTIATRKRIQYADVTHIMVFIGCMNLLIQDAMNTLGGCD